jgi:hypothetical protein
VYVSLIAAIPGTDCPTGVGVTNEYGILGKGLVDPNPPADDTIFPITDCNIDEPKACIELFCQYVYANTTVNL